MVVLSWWVIAFFSLCIFSFLYKNNPFYKFAIHVILGLMVGYMFMQQVVIGLSTSFFSPILLELGRSSTDWFDLLIQRFIPFCIASLIFTLLIPGRQWMKNIPLGLVLGYGMGLMMVTSLESNVFVQLRKTLQPATSVISSGSLYRDRWPQWAQFVPMLSLSVVIGCTLLYQFRMRMPEIKTVIYAALLIFIISLSDSLIILIGVMTVLSYFFFSFERDGVVEEVSRVGLTFMMVYFGAVFGSTLMTRMQIFVGQVEFLTSKWIMGTIQAISGG